MFPVCKKELRQFFSSLTGYIAIIVFLLVNGLVLFVFEDNIFDFGYATLDRFFQFAPWILLLLIPAITMRSFAEEFKTGTYEILQTRPLTRWQITGGKYIGSLVVVLIALLPTFIYIISIQLLSAHGNFRGKKLLVVILILIFLIAILTIIRSKKGQSVGFKYFGFVIVAFFLFLRIIRFVFGFQDIQIDGNIDMGAAFGSYIGLFFLAAVFTAISICCSSFTNNAVVAFIVGLAGCALLYYGFNAISRIPALTGGLDYYVEMIGIDFHYRSISRGLIDTRDVVYFLTVTALFFIITNRNLSKR